MLRMAKKGPPVDCRSWRFRLGLTQVEAARALGIGRRQIQNYESNLAPVGRDRQQPPVVVQLAMRYLAEHPEELPRIESRTVA